MKLIKLLCNANSQGIILLLNSQGIIEFFKYYSIPKKIYADECIVKVNTK
jgi:hypothetical protein